ncbi:conjugal transfer protein TraC [Candidatus Gracilibacteria bacterium]|nr:conjugal transfer protein TraC [Candidatus Gracilibacteria bacterium]
MPVKTSKKTSPDGSTQRHLPFSQIRENIILLKDNSARMVLKCSTINFLLKSEEEQDAIIISFQRFLNTLDFPVQIMVRSNKLDIDGYLEKLKEKAVNQKNSLLQNQTYEYIEYLKKLVEVAQIMKKEFYIVVPFDMEDNRSVKDTGIFGVFKKFWQSFNNSDDIVKIRGQIRKFSDLKKGLAGRTGTVKTSLESIGIRATELEKSELVTLLSDYYNPSLGNLQTMKSDISQYNLVS